MFDTYWIRLSSNAGDLRKVVPSCSKSRKRTLWNMQCNAHTETFTKVNFSLIDWLIMVHVEDRLKRYSSVTKKNQTESLCRPKKAREARKAKESIF